MKKVELRKIQTIGDALTTTFSFVGQNYKPLFKLFATYLAVPILLVGLLMGRGMAKYMAFFNDLSVDPTIVDTDNPFGEVFGELLNPYFIIGSILSVVLYGLIAAVVYQYIKVYNESEDGTVDLELVKANILPNAMKLAGASVVTYIMVICGSMLCLIPGIYLAVALTPMFVVMVDEGKGLGDAVKRSMDLVKDNWWRTFGFMILLYILFSMISSIIQLPLTFATMMGPTMGLENLDLIVGISAAISSILGYITALFMLIAAGVWYYGLVEQQEGTSLIRAMDQIGKDDDKPNLDHFR